MCYVLAKVIYSCMSIRKGFIALVFYQTNNYVSKLVDASLFLYMDTFFPFVFYFSFFLIVVLVLSRSDWFRIWWVYLFIIFTTVLSSYGRLVVKSWWRWLVIRLLSIRSIHMCQDLLSVVVKIVLRRYGKASSSFFTLFLWNLLYAWV